MSGPELGLHPIGEVIAAVLLDGPDDVPEIDAAGVEFVRRALDEYMDRGVELMGAVDCVLAAAHLLEVERGAMHAALELVALVDRKAVIDALIRINEARDEERAEAVEQSAERFRQFTDAQARTDDASDAEPTTDGALKLDSFHFRKRL